MNASLERPRSARSAGALVAGHRALRERDNGATVHDEPQMRFGGRAALEEFTELRWITVGGPEGRHYLI